MKKVMILVLLLLSLVGCSNGKKAFEEDYQMFKGKDHVFKKVSYNTVYNALTSKKGTNIIIFAFDPDLYECPYCMATFPILNEAALESDVEEILYLDIRTMRVDRTEEYLKLIEYIDDQVDDLILREEKLEIIVPDVYIVRDGKILDHHIATVKDSEGKFIYDMDDAQKLQLRNRYIEMFSKIKNA